MTTPHCIIIGGGPAGLFAAETLAKAGVRVDVYERKPTLGRKFLMAGRGGLNLTHSEDLERFIARYGAADVWMRPMIEQFSQDALRAWCEGLGEETFIGSSGRVFPKSFKASPLLRAWQARCEALGVRIHLQHDWTGFDDDGAVCFTTADGAHIKAHGNAVLLTLGGASWPKLGADGGWVDHLAKHNVPITKLRPANCGFIAAWSDVMRERHAGQPLKTIAISIAGAPENVRGDIMVTAQGIEGGAVYALSAAIRQTIERDGHAVVHVDLRPDTTAQALAEKLAAPRSGKSLSTILKSRLGMTPAMTGLLYETADPSSLQAMTPAKLAARIKAVPIRLNAAAGMDRAISSAGGIKLDVVDENMMLTAMPGVFVAGEMLDWEAPTGGYLLQGCFSTGFAAAQGILRWTGHNTDRLR